MPKVPIAQPGQVSTRALPDVDFTTRIDSSVFQGGFTDRDIRSSFVNAGMSFAKDLEREALVERDKANRSNVKIVRDDVISEFNKLRKGETDDAGNVIEPGYFSFSGKSADEKKEEYLKRAKSFLDQADSRITNEEQKEYWSEIKSKLALDFESSIEDHSFRQRMAYTEERLKSGLSTIQEDIVLNYSQPNKIEAGFKDLEKDFNDLADIQGLSKEGREKGLKQLRSSTHKMIIAQMLGEDQDLAASAYFKGAKKDLTVEDKLKLTDMLDEGSLRGNSQRQTDSIMSKNLSQSEALSQARQIENPKLRDEVIRRVKNRYAEDRMIKEESARVLYENAFNKVDKDPRIEAVPEEDWIALKPEHKKNLQTYIDYKIRGKSIPTKWERYYDLKTMATNAGTRDKFLRLDLLNDRLNLADPEFKELVNLQTGLRAGSSEAQSIIDGYRSDKQIVDDTMRAAGFDLRSTDEDDLKAVAEMRAEIDRRVQAHKKKTGKKYIDNIELQSIVDGMFVEGVDPNSGFLGFFKKRKKAYEIEPGQEFELDVDTIPKFDRQRIEQALKLEGKEITEEAIADKYLRRLKKVERAR